MSDRASIETVHLRDISVDWPALSKGRSVPGGRTPLAAKNRIKEGLYEDFMRACWFSATPRMRALLNLKLLGPDEPSHGLAAVLLSPHFRPEALDALVASGVSLQENASGQSLAPVWAQAFGRAKWLDTRPEITAGFRKDLQSALVHVSRRAIVNEWSAKDKDQPVANQPHLAQLRSAGHRLDTDGSHAALLHALHAAPEQFLELSRQKKGELATLAFTAAVTSCDAAAVSLLLQTKDILRPAGQPAYGDPAYKCAPQTMDLSAQSWLMDLLATDQKLQNNFDAVFAGDIPLAFHPSRPSYYVGKDRSLVNTRADPDRTLHMDTQGLAALALNQPDAVSKSNYFAFLDTVAQHQKLALVLSTEAGRKGMIDVALSADSGSGAILLSLLRSPSVTPACLVSWGGERLCRWKNTEGEGFVDLLAAELGQDNKSAAAQKDVDRAVVAVLAAAPPNVIPVSARGNALSLMSPDARAAYESAEMASISPSTKPNRATQRSL